MSLKHKVYGVIFNIFRIFPVKKNLISFVSDSDKSFWGNYQYIQSEIEKSDNDYVFKTVFKDRFSLKGIYTLARSGYIFLNDNFLPLAYMDISDSTKITQLWHGPGVFKKFGYSSVNPDNKDLIYLIRNSSRKIDYLTVSSRNVIKYYREAFQIDENKIIPWGIPRLDFYSSTNISKDNVNKIRNSFEKVHPQIKNKKIILYAPTFRENPEYNNVFDYFDVNKFNNNLSDEYILLVRLHPKINDYIKEEKINVIDCTDYSEQDLLLISDILITDYSSIMVEYSLLNRPIIFFAYDLDNYINNERGFYFDYNDVPGSIVKDTDELIDVIKNHDFRLNKLEKFRKFQFDNIDNKSSKRIVDYIINNNQ